MKPVFKLTDACMCTRNNSKWVLGKWCFPFVMPTKNRPLALCSNNCLHAFTSPWYAVMFGTLYCVDFNPARLFIARAGGKTTSDDNIKLGSAKMMIIKEIEKVEPSICDMARLYYRLSMYKLAKGQLLTAKRVDNLCKNDAVRYAVLKKLYKNPAYVINNTEYWASAYNDDRVHNGTQSLASVHARFVVVDELHRVIHLIHDIMGAKGDAFVLKTMDKILGKYPIKEIK